MLGQRDARAEGCLGRGMIRQRDARPEGCSAGGMLRVVEKTTGPWG